MPVSRESRPQVLPASALGQLRRYQRLLMFGGGIVVTIVVLLAFALDLVSTVRSYIAAEQQAYLVDRSLVTSEIEASEASFRNGLISAELLWGENHRASQALISSFEAEGSELIIQPSPAVRPHLFVGTPDQPASPDDLARNLGLAVQLARVSMAGSLMRGRPLTGYYYSTTSDLTGFIPAPSPRDAQVAAALANRRGLLESLRIDFGDLSRERVMEPFASRRTVHWLAPFVNPLSGKHVVRLAAPAYDHGKPFAVLVTEYALGELTAPLSVDRFTGAFMIVSADGQLIDAASRDAPSAAMLKAALHSRVAGVSAGRPAEHYADGIFTISDRLADTGWSLVYVYSWRSIAAGVALPVGTSAITTLVIIVVMWALLLVFNRRVFVPVFERSQHVFDSEHLSRTLIGTAPVGLGLIEQHSGKPLLRSPVMAEMAARMTVDAPTLSAEFVQRHNALNRAVRDTSRDRGADASVPSPVVRDDMSLQTRDGETVHLALSIAPARYQGTDVLVAAFSDVTEKHRLEQQLLAAKQAADAANAAKSSFLAAMSHEIRTPLNAILGNLELLARSPLTDTQSDRLTTVRTSSTGLLTIISDILDFSKIEAGEMSLEDIEFDVVDVAERALMIFAPLANERGIHLHARFTTASSVWMRGDPTRLGQVLHNLLGNAIKFTPAGTVSLLLCVEPGPDGEPAIAIAVEDTGIGLSRDQLDGIFQAFTQADASINRRFGGTGLGLALCRRLVGAMRGKISVESKLHDGSRFTVRLPLATRIPVAPDKRIFSGQRVIFLASNDAWRDWAIPHLEAWGLRTHVFTHPALVDVEMLAAADVLVICGDHDNWHPEEENRLVEEASRIVDCRYDGPARPVRMSRIFSVSCYSLKGIQGALRQAVLNEAPFVATGEPEAHTMGEALPRNGPRLRVLLAEDNTVNRKLFAEQLETLGCDAYVARSGDEALDALSSDKWDVLLTDLNMPGMSGYELADTVRQRWPSLPVIAVTAHATTNELARAHAAGMSEVLIKPLSLQQLYDCLARVARAGQAVVEPGDGPDAVLGTKPIPAALHDSFKASSIESLRTIRQAYEDGDKPKLLAELHSMKGTFGVFGHSSLAQQWAALETLITQDDADKRTDVRAALDDLEAQTRTLFPD
ncbi:ATP-binding protein [Paraburkholderia metrosideri]|uniref:histidine kinase n=1 Tax=Paraburkholderia metrosideri TaxID=580937 RepID=A0ABW9DSK8_9BURK